MKQGLRKILVHTGSNSVITTAQVHRQVWHRLRCGRASRALYWVQRARQWDVVLPVAGPWQGQSRAVRSRLAVLRAGGVRGKLVLGMPFKKLMERRGTMETRLTYITRSPNGSSMN